MSANVIDKLAWVQITDRKVLMTRSRGKDTYYIPGGKREAGEADAEALMREVREELSVQLLPDMIQYLGTFEAQAHGKAEGVIVRMTCYWSDFEGDLQPASEIEEMAWFRYPDRKKSSPVDHLIFEWLKQRDLID